MINYFAAEYENTSDGETNICSVKTELLEDGANSSLAVARADKQDSGNYTCSISPTEFATVAIHVLNGKINFTQTHNTRQMLLSQRTINIMKPFVSAQRKRFTECLVNIHINKDYIRVSDDFTLEISQDFILEVKFSAKTLNNI